MYSFLIKTNRKFDEIHKFMIAQFILFDNQTFAQKILAYTNRHTTIWSYTIRFRTVWNITLFINSPYFFKYIKIKSKRIIDEIYKFTIAFILFDNQTFAQYVTRVHDSRTHDSFQDNRKTTWWINDLIIVLWFNLVISFYKNFPGSYSTLDV